MKSLIAFITLALLSFPSFAETITAQSEDSILSSVLSVKTTSSNASQLDVRVIELIGGDGLNPTRMAVVFQSSYYEPAKVFQLDTMLYSVDRITFLAIDTLVINYTQDDMDQDGNNLQVRRSLQIKIERNADGSLSDKAIITQLR